MSASPILGTPLRSRPVRRVPVLACLAVPLLTALAPTASEAQAPDGLPTIADSALIRVWAKESGHKGTKAVFSAWTDSSLVAVRTRGHEPLALSYAEISRLDVRTGRSVPLGVLRGAAVGGGVGGLVGLLVGLSATSGCEGFLCGLDSFDHAATGLGIGAALGALLGAGAPVDQWTRQALPESMGFAEPQRESITGQVLVVFGSLLLLASLGG